MVATITPLVWQVTHADTEALAQLSLFLGTLAASRACRDDSGVALCAKRVLQMLPNLGQREGATFVGRIIDV